MARAASRKRGMAKDTKRRGKKKTSILSAEHIEYVDYKDVDLLKRFMSDRAKIRGRRVNGNDVQQQRLVSRAIKNAREMGLLPYTSRVTTQRRSRQERSDSGRDDTERRPRDDAERRDRDDTERRPPEDRGERDTTAASTEGGEE